MTERNLLSCKDCLAKFKPRQPEQTYCRACQPIHFTPEQPAPEGLIYCGCGCGDTLFPTDSRGRPRTIISGHNDAYDGRHTPTLICDICGRAFRRRSAKQRLCSMACRHEKNKAPKPMLHRQIELSCHTCGTLFSRKQSGGNLSGRNFCCQSCKNQWMAETYPQRISRPMKLARQRDSHKCSICQFDILVEVHHITPRREEGKDELGNLITLCPNHHTMADRGLLERDYLRSLIP